MPLPNLPVPAFPFVPLMVGVPGLMRAPIDIQAPNLLNQAATTGVTPPVLMSMLNGSIPSMLNGVTEPLGNLASDLSPQPVTGDSSSEIGGTSSAPQWGIFDDGGNAVITPDSIVSVSWRGSYRVISYPIEGGNFETYNKVQQPFEVRVVMRQGGSPSDRQSFINTLNSIRADLRLYTVTTPEVSYASVNITDVQYERRAEVGATVIEPTITLQQINVSASASFSNVAAPTSQDSFNDGTVDSTTPTPTQASAATGGPT